MSFNRTSLEQTQKLHCKHCTLSSSTQLYQGLCSACSKYPPSQPSTIKTQLPNQPPSSPLLTSTHPSPNPNQSQIISIKQVPKPPIQQNKKKCYTCRKNIGLLGISCKCGFIFCNAHRLPEQHRCNFNFLESGKKQLQKNIIKVYNGKISQI